MKKNLFYAFAGAIALSGAVGFSSCSSSEDTVDVSPNYDEKKGEVLTQFVFSISTGNTATTRMSEAATQAVNTATFRGIDDAHIMCFKQASNGQWVATPTTADRDYPMNNVAAASTISKDQSRRVLEMSLPLKTNSIVFYGRAAGNDDPEKYGKLKNADGTDGYNVSSNLNNVYFHLAKRLSSANKTKFEQTQKLLAAVLTCVMNVNRGTDNVSSTQAPTGVTKTYKFDIPNTTGVGGVQNMPWSKYVYGGKSPVSTSDDLYPLEEKLAKVYKEMTTIQDQELRNASGPALQSTIQNLWSVVNSVRCAEPVNEAEAMAKYMAHLITVELGKYFNYTGLPGDGGSVTGVSIKDAQTIVAALTANTEVYWPSGQTAQTKPTEDEFSTIKEITDENYLNLFPANFNLPQGSTHVTFDTTTKLYAYAVNYATGGVGGGSFTVDDYYYPPELLYFGNGPIRVSDVEHVVSDYPIKTDQWDTELSSTPSESEPWYGWTTNGEVQSSTRSVALRNDINYGTSLLNTTVGYTADVSSGATKLQDNNKYIQQRDYGVSEDNNEITPTASSFILKGVLVGGQYPQVGWNFLPKHADGERQGYVYDNKITNDGNIPVTGSSTSNYTLLFDNYNSTAPQDKVYVALELMNNTGQDFFGKDNLIPNGSNFYLIGELDPSGKDAPTWPTYHALPPYTNGTTMNYVTRVFIQDYMTTANFKIGEYSLQYAYLTVPDLRSSSVTLGLSVDMNWSTGLTFNNVIIGGNTQTPMPNP